MFGDLIFTKPLLVGFKLHTEVVIASNLSNGCPNLLKDRGYKCH